MQICFLTYAKCFFFFLSYFSSIFEYYTGALVITSKPSTIRLILNIALLKGWKIKQLDFNNAFSNRDMIESIYITQLEGFVQGD